MKSPKYSYPKVQSCWQEPYQPPITVSLPLWSDWVAKGYNTLYDGVIIPSDTILDNSVYTGHVKQNPFTANVIYYN